LTDQARVQKQRDPRYRPGYGSHSSLLTQTHPAFGHWRHCTTHFFFSFWNSSCPKNCTAISWKILHSGQDPSDLSTYCKSFSPGRFSVKRISVWSVSQGTCYRQKYLHSAN